MKTQNPVLKGEVFGSLTATGHNKPGIGRHAPTKDQVKCKCGKMVWVDHQCLRPKDRNPQQCCGRDCQFNPRKKPPIKGERFPDSHLIATGEWEIRAGGTGYRRVFAKFMCDCGRVTWTDLVSVRSGRSKSCGYRCPYSREGIIIDQKRCYRGYKTNCLLRDFVPLSFDDWLPVATLSCIYCGIPPRLFSVDKCLVGFDRKPFFFNGIDHFNPNIKSPKGNSLPCCIPCNYEKRDMTSQEWKDRLIRTRGKMKALKILYRVKMYLRKQKEN